jgi:hypothetical protein
LRIDSKRLVVMRRAGTAAVLDEKQDFDMTWAGALAGALLIPAMLAAFPLHGRGLLRKNRTPGT